MKKNLSICFIIIFIAFISGCVEPDTVPSAENVSVESVPLAENVSHKGDYAALFIKEIEDIDNGTYFEITDDELKEHPEINKSIRGEGCTQFDSGGWYCELNSDEVGRYSDFMDRKRVPDIFDVKHYEYLFKIDKKFKKNLDDNISDVELINIFKSNGFPLSENYSIITRSEINSSNKSWWIDTEDTVDTFYTPEYIIWDIKNELKVYNSPYIDPKFTKIGELYYEIQLAVT